jgi:hypothetical protein
MDSGVPSEKPSGSEEDAPTTKQALVGRLTTLPGAIAAALATGLVGALIAYFVPGILDRVTGEDRPRVSLQTNPATIDTFVNRSHHLIVPRGETMSGSPGRGCAGFYPWGDRIGGIPAGETNFRLIVQGGADQTLISGIRARVIERDPPLSGTGFVCPTQAGVEPRSLSIDLDEPNPIGKVLDNGKERPVAFTVSEDETEVFDISAETSDCYCTWILELVTTQKGKEELISVSKGGTPFETTAWPAHARRIDDERPYYTWDPFTAAGWTGRGMRSPAEAASLPELPTFTPKTRGGPLLSDAELAKQAQGEDAPAP